MDACSFIPSTEPKEPNPKWKPVTIKILSRKSGELTKSSNGVSNIPLFAKLPSKPQGRDSYSQVLICIHLIKKTSGFATTHLVVFLTHTGEKPDARVKCGHAIFLLTVRRIRMFFSLKLSLSQGESSLKISARWGSPFRRS